MDVARAILDGLDDDQIGELDDGRLFAGGGELVEADVLDRFPDVFDGVGVGLGLFCFCASWMMSSIEPPLAESMAVSLSAMAFSDAMSGAISSLVMRLTSSRARTFSGSAMARNNLFSSREMGMTWWLCIVSRGSNSTSSGGMLGRARLIGRDVEHAAHAHGQVLFADVGFFDDELDEARALLFLLFKQFLHLVRAQQTVLDERVGDAFSE